jgi:hypothetical protein
MKRNGSLGGLSKNSSQNLLQNINTVLKMARQEALVPAPKFTDRKASMSVAGNPMPLSGGYDFMSA